MGLDLELIAIHILNIDRDFKERLMMEKSESCVSDFKLETFTQIWGNTRGGFEGLGGCAMTEQRTYVLIPKYNNEKVYVYFEGMFAYSVPYCDEIIEDIKNGRVAGCSDYSKYIK